MSSDPASPDSRSAAGAQNHRTPGSPADPCVMVICGATGDLTKRKLLPALYNLAKEKLLARDFAIVAIARGAMSTDAFREQLARDLAQFATTQVEPELWQWFAQRIRYLSGSFDDPATYAALKTMLAEVDAEHATHGNYFYYLAVAPELFGGIVRHLGAAQLLREDNGRWRRVIIEKPFGRDLESARALNAEMRNALSERQIYRIDHYLGKETVQNILVFRFGNGVFEPIWDRRYIDHVQITAAETVGVEQRGGYYNTSGALRDMVPNHLFQLVSLTAMEPPVSFSADAVRDEQAKVLHAIQPLAPEEVLSRTVRGQYGDGIDAETPLTAYRAEPRVPADSPTETYAALKVTIDNWRWADVPFYLRSGKRMARRMTEIVIQFRRVPFMLFRDTPVEHLHRNQLIIRIQPDEGIELHFGAKVPGPQMRVGGVNMQFCYRDHFGVAPSTGYERLLYDCMIGDATLFQRADMVEAGWRVITPILDVWKALPPRAFPNYAAGSWGPKEADELIERDGRHWRIHHA
jgi:glucose-6-phosphate 1-dehydrogenase